MLHRLACFRDDVVFLILIYQRWIYRIDPTRENEYGKYLFLVASLFWFIPSSRPRSSSPFIL